MTQQFAALLADVNAQIAAHEKLHALIIVKDEWNIENGYLTPTMKIKRSVVESAYEPRLGEWYAADKGSLLGGVDPLPIKLEAFLNLSHTEKIIGNTFKTALGR